MARSPASRLLRIVIWPPFCGVMAAAFPAEAGPTYGNCVVSGCDEAALLNACGVSGCSRTDCRSALARERGVSAPFTSPDPTRSPASRLLRIVTWPPFCGAMAAAFPAKAGPTYGGCGVSGCSRTDCRSALARECGVSTPFTSPDPTRSPASRLLRIFVRYPFCGVMDAAFPAKAGPTYGNCVVSGCEEAALLNACGVSGCTPTDCRSALARECGVSAPFTSLDPTRSPASRLLQIVTRHPFCGMTPDAFPAKASDQTSDTVTQRISFAARRMAVARRSTSMASAKSVPLPPFPCSA
jgi:hypothetical protein